jgi:hypothetical protein
MRSSGVSPFRPHPWHGLDAGPAPPEILNRRAPKRHATAYGRTHALKVVRAAMADYDEHYTLQ